MNEQMEILVLGNILCVVVEIKINVDVIKAEIKDIEYIPACDDCYEDNVRMGMISLLQI